MIGFVNCVHFCFKGIFQKELWRGGVKSREDFENEFPWLIKEWKLFEREEEMDQQLNDCASKGLWNLKALNAGTSS